MSANIKVKKESNINLDILDNIRTAIVIINDKYEYIYGNVAADDIIGSAKSVLKIDQLPCDDTSLVSYIDEVMELSLIHI